MAMVGRPTGWENTTHATLALPAADSVPERQLSAVIDRRWGTACFYHHDTKTVVLRALADVETQTDRPLGNAGPLVNRSPRGRLTLRQDWAI
jgi:hypothetical protein